MAASAIRGGFGHPGSFGMITWSEPDASGRRHGLCMAMIRFSTPIRAFGLISCGDSRQPGPGHDSDQPDLPSKDQFRQFWPQPSETELHVAERTRLKG